MPFSASDRRRRGALARPHRTFLPLLPSCRAIVQVEMRSYCVHDALLWRQDAAAAVLSPSTSDVCIALAIMQGDRSSRDALEALMVLDALFGVRLPPSLCSRRPLMTFIPLSPSCKAGSFKTRCARCVLMVLDALSGVDPAVAVLSPSTICLYRLPSCRAIIQVETRSYCVHGARCPSLASGRRRCCALAVHIGR